MATLLGIGGARKGMDLCLLFLCASIQIAMLAQRWHLFAAIQHLSVSMCCLYVCVLLFSVRHVRKG